MPSGAAVAQLVADRAVVVVEGGVEAELVGRSATFRPSRRCRSPGRRPSAWRSGRPGCRPRRPRRRRRRTSPVLHARRLSRPAYAVRPGMPSTPRYAERARARVDLRRAARRRAARTPASRSRAAPVADREALGARSATTSPTAPPSQRRVQLERRRRRTSRRSSGRACTGRRTCTGCGPGPGRGRGRAASASTSPKCPAVGQPCGRAASWISRLVGTGTTLFARTGLSVAPSG